MGISDRRTLKHMKDPERGVFRVSSLHDVYPGTPPPGDHIVGTISGPGIPDTAAEHKLDHHGHWPPGSELPITIDRRDPSKYVILWDEAPRGIGDAMRAMQSRQPGQDLFGLLQDVMAQQQQHHQRHVPGEPVVMTSGTTMDMSQLPEITKPDGSLSVATTRIGFSSPERCAAVATVGNRLQVRVDPLNPAKVAIGPQDPS